MIQNRNESGLKMVFNKALWFHRGEQKGEDHGDHSLPR